MRLIRDEIARSILWTWLKVRLVIVWMPLVLVLFVVIVVWGAGVTDQTKSPGPTPTPPPMPRIDASVGKGQLVEAGTEVWHDVTIRNTGQVTVNLRLQLSGPILLDNVRLYRSTDDSPVELTEGDADLGPLVPGDKRDYRLVVYRRAENNFAQEPAFKVTVVGEFGTVTDEQPISVSSAPQMDAGVLHVYKPPSSIQQPGLVFTLTYTAAVSGRYVLACYDAKELPQSKTVNVLPREPAVWICPAEPGLSGMWSARVHPQMSSGHPDEQTSESALEPLASQEFEVTATKYGVEVSKLEVCDPDPKQPLVGVRYVLTNTGNLPDVVWASYTPTTTHALTMTLRLFDSGSQPVVVSTGEPFSLTLAPNQDSFVPLLPDGRSLGPGQMITLLAVVRHDKNMPIGFVLRFVPHSTQEKDALEIRTEEMIGKLPELPCHR